MDTKNTEKILKALANKRRIGIIKFLGKKGRAIVGDIAREIKLSFRSTSRHLAVLTAADILERNQHGLNAYYSINYNNKTARKIMSLFSI